MDKEIQIRLKQFQQGLDELTNRAEVDLFERVQQRLLRWSKTSLSVGLTIGTITFLATLAGAVKIATDSAERATNMAIAQAELCARRADELFTHAESVISKVNEVTKEAASATDHTKIATSQATAEAERAAKAVKKERDQLERLRSGYESLERNAIATRDEAIPLLTRDVHRTEDLVKALRLVLPESTFPKDLSSKLQSRDPNDQLLAASLLQLWAAPQQKVLDAAADLIDRSQPIAEETPQFRALERTCESLALAGKTQLLLDRIPKENNYADRFAAIRQLAMIRALERADPVPQDLVNSFRAAVDLNPDAIVSFFLRKDLAGFDQNDRVEIRRLVEGILNNNNTKLISGAQQILKSLEPADKSSLTTP